MNTVFMLIVISSVWMHTSYGSSRLVNVVVKGEVFKTKEDCMVSVKKHPQKSFCVETYNE